ncbi:MAG TPA: Uma2 family endonuclease [Enhygromyxa sp.]|nr:Uma2 family endonuclease [Enhygromyxa sp.]
MDEATYLAFDRGSEAKHELWDGEVYAMTGASVAHNLIVMNLSFELTGALRGSECRALPSDMRVRIPKRGYVYPDLTIVCGPLELEGETDILLNPRAVIEVLSPSTADFNRGAKFDGYRSISIVQEVLFVAQDERQVAHHTRQADGSWVLREYRDDDAVPLVSLPRPLPLGAIYYDVDL